MEKEVCKQQIISYDHHLNKSIKKLYQDKPPKKHIFSSEDVIFGNYLSNVAIAFIYNWKSDKPPQEIQDLFLKLSNYAAITGYWRTTNGGKYVFSNLLSNPNINKLVVLTFDAKDNGHLLVDALKNLWKYGTNKDNLIIGSNAPNPKFEGISPEGLTRATKQIDLVVLSNISDLNIPEQLIKAQIQEPLNAIPCSNFQNLEFYSNYKDNHLMYDDGCRFDKPFEVNFSSSTEKIKFNEAKQKLLSIEVDDLDEAIKQTSSFIFENGESSTDQRNINTFEYRSFSLTVKDPLSKIPENFSKDYILKYVKEFMQGVGEGLKDFAYTYHDRIFKKWGNQVKKATKILKDNPSTRRALISLWDPVNDINSSNPPCLDFIWPCIRNDKLEFHITYRSHHIATITKEGMLVKGEGALVPNLYALATLQESMSKELNIKRGSLHLNDLSGHLYVAEE